jgi:hypothetical protein
MKAPIGTMVGASSGGLAFWGMAEPEISAKQGGQQSRCMGAPTDFVVTFCAYHTS